MLFLKADHETFSLIIVSLKINRLGFHSEAIYSSSKADFPVNYKEEMHKAPFLINHCKMVSISRGYLVHNRAFDLLMLACVSANMSGKFAPILKCITYTFPAWKRLIFQLQTHCVLLVFYGLWSCVSEAVTAIKGVDWLIIRRISVQ